MKILLGGIPLGCDNIGDEAILACVVRLMREIAPSAELAVATNDAATATLLGVKVVPSYGFAGVSTKGFNAIVKAFDVYVWCGATGLSDYPFVALDLLRLAQKAGVRTFVWGVGMDNELNPVFFKARGRRRRLLACVGLVGLYEGILRRRLTRQVCATLPKCAGVWLRDPESAEVLARFGYGQAATTSDTAIYQSRSTVRTASRASTLGFCLSAQRAVTDTTGVKRFLARLSSAGLSVVGIPMNPKTDSVLLRTLGVTDIFGGTTPDAVARKAASCDLVLSNRLHLLILAANVGTPILGLARGSKLVNWLANFGETTEGSVFDCDWDALAAKVVRLLDDPPRLRAHFAVVRQAAYARLDARFEEAKRTFAARLLASGMDGHCGQSV